MFKLIKKLIKAIAVIIGAYAAFNTYVLARMGVSRVKRQMRLQYPDRKITDDFWTCAWNVDGAALEEMEEEEQAWNDYKEGKN